MSEQEIRPTGENGINVDAVRNYMLSQDEGLLEVMENLKRNPNRLNLDEVLDQKK